MLHFSNEWIVEITEVLFCAHRVLGENAGMDSKKSCVDLSVEI